MVVLHHGRDLARDTFPGIADLQLGAAGVDIFFILSGMVITLAEVGQVRDPAGYMSRRLVRVVPMYWLALAVVGLLLVVGMTPLGISENDATIGNMLRSMMFVPFLREHGGLMPLLGVGWTLNFEMFFYLVFALTLLLPARGQLPGLAAIMLLFVAAGLVLRPTNAVAVVYTNPLLLEFLAGVGLAYWWMRRAPGPRSSDRVLGLGFVLAGLVGFALSARPEEFHELIGSRVLFFGLPALSCVIGALLLESGGIAARARWWHLAGAASYALYLFHPLVLQVVEKLVHGFNLDLGNGAVVLAAIVVGVVASHVAGLVIHLWIERPLTRFLRQFVGIKRSVLPPLPTQKVG